MWQWCVKRPRAVDYAERFPGVEMAWLTDNIQQPNDPWETVATGGWPSPRLISRSPDGEPVEGYRLVRVLGKGGVGEVWEARAPGGVPIALKRVQIRDGCGHASLRPWTFSNESATPTYSRCTATGCSAITWSSAWSWLKKASERCYSAGRRAAGRACRKTR
jgi:hypothetical protein